MGMSTDALGVFVQVMTNRKLDSSGDPTSDPVWTGNNSNQNHITFLFGNGAKQLSGSDPGGAIISLGTTQGVSLTIPSGVTSSDFDWIAGVITTLENQNVWTKPTNTNNSNNFVQVMANRVSSSYMEAREDSVIESANAEYY